MGRVDATCYIERSKVREILIASDIDNENTRTVLQAVDALPIVTAGDFRTPLSDHDIAGLLANAIFAENLDEMPTKRDEYGPSWCQADMIEAAQEIQRAGFEVIKKPMSSALPSTDSKVSPHAG